MKPVNSTDYPDRIAVGLDRESKILLDGDWQFQTDPKEMGEREGWATPGKITERTAKVPLPWALVDDDLRGYFGVVWYSREIDIPRNFAGQRIRLGFYGVGHTARIFVNGRLAGEHTGLQAPFILDITALARPGERNTITVRVFQPQSGTSIYMDTHSLLRVCGIWRSVWIEATGLDFISDLFIMPNIDMGQATARVTVCVPSASEARAYSLSIVATDPHGNTFEQSGTVEVAAKGEPAFYTTDLVIAIPDPMLWDLEHRNLYNVKAALTGPDGQVLDSVADRFGMRKIEAKDGRFFLNNRVIYLVGGGIDPLPFGGSGDVNWHLPGPYAYPGDEEIREDIRKIKALGVNFVRIPLRPMHPQWLKLADEEGLLVWQEASWTHFTELEDWKNTWSECLLRDRNHPSAIVWTLFNESWGYEFADPIYEHVKRLDPTRLVLDNTGGLVLSDANLPGNHGKTDFEDVHNYPGFNHFSRDYWLSLRRVIPDRPLMVTEFGPIPYMFNLGKFREKWGGKDAWWISSGRALCDDPTKDAQPPCWNHLGYEQRFKDWGMEDLYQNWDAFVAAHDWFYFWGLKSQTQWMRMNNKIGGFLAWIWDNGQHATGAIDNFGEPKVFAGELGKIWTQDLVIIDNERHNFWGGESVSAIVYLSHYSGEDLTGAVIRWEVEGTSIQGKFPVQSLDPGDSQAVGGLTFQAPDEANSVQRTVITRLVSKEGRTLSENWEPIWFFPMAWRKASEIPLTLVSIANQLPMTMFGYNNVPLEQNPKVVVTGTMDGQVQQYVKDGGTALYFPTDQEEFLTESGLQLGPSILGGHTDCYYARKGTGVFDRIPFENPYIWQFYKIWSTAALTGVGPQNHTDILAGGYMNLLNNQVATVVQFRYGKGRLIISTHNLPGLVHDDPAAVVIFNDLLRYAAGDFQPEARLDR